MGNICDCIDDDTEKEEKEELLDLEDRAKAFVTVRTFHHPSTEEGKYRLEHETEIQNKRWEWYKKNSKLFALILKNNGFDEEDIKCSMDGTKPIGMKIEFFNEFKQLLFNSIKEISNRMESDYPDLGDIRVVLQGSYTVGYSSNPLKGDRYIPNYLFMPSKKSDYDFRCFAENLDGYVDKLRKDGIEIDDRANKGKPEVIKPKSVSNIFPEFTKLIKDFEEISKKYFDGKSVKLQITVFTKNINFEAYPWDFEMKK